MKKKLLSIQKLNISAFIANHFIGEEHTNTHRRLIGFIIMTVGVGIAKVTHVYGVFIIQFMGDIIGYGLHGLGLIPFVSKIEKMTKDLKNEKIIQNEEVVEK